VTMTVDGTYMGMISEMLGNIQKCCPSHSFDRCAFSKANVDERLSPDLSRGRGKSIGGDLNIDEEGSDQMIKILHSLHRGSIGNEHACTRVGLTKKTYPCKRNQEHKQE
jgi:hypothetical protein